jgi:sporulation protein YunB
MFWKRFIRRLIVVVLLATLVVMVFRRHYNEPVCQLAQVQIMNATSDLINDAIDKQIAAGNIQYDRIIYFEKDLDGQITALKTNMSEVNRLKTAILNLINDEILELDTKDLGIPVGSLMLPELFSGRGPDIPIHIISIRNSEGAFSSNFTEAGINQTLQQIIMDVSVDVTVLVFGKTTSFTVNSQVVVAETVIVGKVPDTFFQTGGYNGNTKENG